jgi:hypothetical protein
MGLVARITSWPASCSPWQRLTKGCSSPREPIVARTIFKLSGSHEILCSLLPAQRKVLAAAAVTARLDPITHYFWLAVHTISGAAAVRWMRC